MKHKEIPGLIELVESEGLVKAGKLVPEGTSIVEFGCYLGRSTQAILDGVNGGNKGIKFFVFDRFCIPSSDTFSQTLVRHVKGMNLIDKIYVDKEKMLHWEKVFEELIEPENNVELKWEKEELKRFRFHEIENISLLHIDAPKSYQEFKPIFYNHFPALVEGARVIFQDFFYHWSSTIIAVVEVMRKKNMIEIIEGRASSLEVYVSKKIKYEDILSVDLELEFSEILELLDSSLDYFNTNQEKIDRPEFFLPRIKMAKFIHAKSIGKDKVAHDILVELLKKKEFQFIINDFLESIEKDFDIEYHRR
ncbi:hypothetical protein N9V13_05575 [Betaproteobacteria bacterium]|nr:hypothetical protein [Betaproteobacteria bacterium]